jgi:ribose transport system permease protein
MRRRGLISFGGIKTVKNRIDWSRHGIFFALILLIVVFSLFENSFLKVNNIINILRQVSIVGICAVGMTFVILTGGMDLSVGSVIGVSAVSSALLMSGGTNPLLAVLLAIMIGAATGLINGFFINNVGIAPIIVTLGMMTLLRGAAYIISGGLPVYGIPENYLFMGQGYVGGIPVPVIFMVVIFSLGYFILNKTTFGRSVYGIGGNAEASRLSGVNVKGVIYRVYAFAGVLYSLAGLILLARVNSGQPKSGSGYEMDVITACVLGGISVSGGEGRVGGVIVGVLFMGTLANGMILMNVPEFWQWVVQGSVLILAVSLDKWTMKSKNRI